MAGKPRHILLEIYQRLLAGYRPQHWWPGDSPFEVIIGAILTQSAAWSNVEKAINNLKSAGALSPNQILKMPIKELARLIRPSGYYNAKAVKLKAFIEWLDNNYRNSLEELSFIPTVDLRQCLLSIHGVGPETADSILLYALNRPVFVIDAYTKRIISRIGLLSETSQYDDYQAYFMRSLPMDLHLFNEYHALLVRLGKEACNKKPLCFKCCIKAFCKYNLKSSKAGN